MTLWLWSVAALAQEVCDVPELSEPDDALSVAWVSPLGKHARGKAWLYVVPTSDLRAFGKEADGNIGRVLQWMGMRRKAKAPTRRYKVVVFDTTPDAICRPIEPSKEGSIEPISGVRPCDEDHRGAQGQYEGCGFLTDRSNGEPSIEVYRAQWNALANNGFCVLPLERFLGR
jgi:hypothetical protein